MTSVEVTACRKFALDFNCGLVLSFIKIRKVFLMTDAVLKKFAETVLQVGVNLQENQGLEIICPVEKSEVAEAIAKAAYKMKAKIVRVRWECENIDRLTYLNASTQTLSDIPKWIVDSKNYLVENGFCYIAIAAENPSAFKGVPSEKIAAAARARGKALKKFFEDVKIK